MTTSLITIKCMIIPNNMPSLMLMRSLTCKSWKSSLRAKSTIRTNTIIFSWTMLKTLGTNNLSRKKFLRNIWVSWKIQGYLLILSTIHGPKASSFSTSRRVVCCKSSTCTMTGFSSMSITRVKLDLWS